MVAGFLQKSLVLWCGITVVLLSLNGLAFYHNMRTLVDNDHSVLRTQDVLSSLDGVLTTMNAAEAAQRGYIITGEESYLAPYTAATAGIWPQVARLQTLTADEPQQQQRLAPLRALIAARFAELQLTIGLRRDGSVAAATRVVLSDRGKDLMDALRGTVAGMRSAEVARLDRRTADSRRAAEVTTLSLLLATLANIALLGGLFVLIQRGIARTAQQLEERGRLAEREQAARGAAEAALRARDTFLSLASHELRTPLTALLGNAQLLRRFGQHDALDARAVRALDQIERQGERLRALTEQLLDTSRLQAGQLSIQTLPLDLAALVRQVVAEMRATAERHTLRVTGEEGPLRIAGDALRLEQVLHNLLGNAIKYSPDGGPITVRLAREGASALLEVADRGIGIPAPAQPQLFDRFFRAANAQTTGIGGLGIGLYVVKEVVTRHGGTIEVSSVEGQGTVFTIRLPLLDGAA